MEKMSPDVFVTCMCVCSVFYVSVCDSYESFSKYVYAPMCLLQRHERQSEYGQGEIPIRWYDVTADPAVTQ